MLIILKDKLTLYLVKEAFISLLESKKVYIVHDRHIQKTYISQEILLFENKQIRLSKVYIIVSDNNESDEKINVIIGTDSNLYLTQDFDRSKVLAESLFNTAFKDSSTKLVVRGSKASTFNILISATTLNLLLKVLR